MSKVRIRVKYIANGIVHKVKCFKPEIIEAEQLDAIRRRETNKLRAREPDELKREKIDVFFGVDNDLEFDIRNL